MALVCAAFAQAPAFEAASVRISEPITPELVRSGRLQIGVSLDSNRVRISKLSLGDLIRFAYQIKSYQFSGPEWTNSARYDIQATLPEGAKRAQVPAMLQTLLTERFRLAIHREPREMTVLALVVAKGGHRLEPSSPPEMNGQPQIRGGATVADGATVRSGPGGESRVTPGSNGNVHIETAHMNLAAFADLLNGYTERPVVDMTGIGGTWAMQIDVSGEELRNARRAAGAAIPPPPADAVSDPAGVSLTSSLARLGLKLETRKAPIEVIVVDHADKVPTEN